MNELLNSLTYWHWLAFGLALLAAELLGAAGYLLWLGISALLVGGLLTFIPMSWQLQWVSFGVFSLVTTWLWWRKQFKKDKTLDDTRNLNQKEKQLIGQVITLDSDIPAGRGRIRVGDTTWSAYSEHEIKAGSAVVITELNGITLTIEPKAD